MAAKAKTTPDAMLADALGNAARKAGDGERTADSPERKDSPEAEAGAPAASARKARSATPAPKTAASAANGPAPASDAVHKLQIIIPAELYTAMQLHKCRHGREKGEKSLKDVGINAITAYVVESLEEVRRYG